MNAFSGSRPPRWRKNQPSASVFKQTTVSNCLITKTYLYPMPLKIFAGLERCWFIYGESAQLCDAEPGKSSA